MKVLSRRLLVVCFDLLLCSVAWAQQKTESEESDINNKRLEWFWSQRTYPQGSIPHHIRLQAIRGMQQMSPQVKARPLSAGLSTTVWTSIGPQPIGVNQSYVVPQAGRVWSLA